MANNLSDEIKVLYQRTGTNAGMLRTEGERAAFAANVKADIANIIYQYNVVVKPLFAALSSEEGLNALDFGLSGNVVFTHKTATAADAVAFYDSDLARARTVKETVDVLLSELARLENLIDNIQDVVEYDDTELRTLIGTNELDIEQLAKDTMGPNYTLDGDGVANRTYSLSQALDAIGAFFSGFPGTGNTYASTYPSLAFAVNLSDVVLDTTIPISTITNLTDYLSYIRDFVGMGSVGPETPTYSAHGAITTVSDGDSLEEAIQKVDAGIAGHTLQKAYTAGSGTAGQILLDNAKGAIAIKDDTVSPVGVMVTWYDSTNTLIGGLDKDGIQLTSNKSRVKMAQAAADPVAAASNGIVVVRPDATSTSSELFYRNSNALDTITQVTRSGIVKELELGCDWVRPSAMVQSGGAPVTRNSVVLGAAPNTDMEYEAVQMQDTLGTPTVYITLAPPQDEDGKFPAEVNVDLYTAPTTNPGAGPFQYVMTMYANDTNPGADPQAELRVPVTDTLVPAQWTSLGDKSSGNFNLPADLNRIYLANWKFTVGSSSEGLVVLKLTRNTGHVDDNFTGDVSIIGARCTWYRG